MRQSYVLRQRPVCAFFRPRPTTPRHPAREANHSGPQGAQRSPAGLSLAELAERLVASKFATLDAVRQLEPAVGWFSGRGWRCRLRSPREQRLLDRGD